MFLETICIKNGVAQNLEQHIKRMQNTAHSFGFQAPILPDLSVQMPTELRESPKVKCSIVYHKQILNITFTEYQTKTINSLKLVEANVDYSFKYSDRSELNELLQKKGDCDEILIVKNNCITDTSFSNVVFRKNNDFFTPDTYLLNGIKRQTLLANKTITETRITVSDLHQFDIVYLINAMLDIEDNLSLSMDKLLNSTT